MAKIIELCGVAGVGKSTIFRAMISKWAQSSRWVPAHFLFPQERLKFDSLSKFLLSIERKFAIGEGNIDQRVLKSYGDRFLAQHPEYINICWSNIFSEYYKVGNGSDSRFDKARYLYNTLQKVQYLREFNTGKISILDEGLVHRVANGLYRRNNSEEEKKEIVNLVQLMPLPDALVYVATDEKEVARRLYNRRKVTVSHEFLSLQELENISKASLERMTIVMQNLESRGIPVLHVNSKLEAETNASSIIRFVEELNKEVFATK